MMMAAFYCPTQPDSHLPFLLAFGVGCWLWQCNVSYMFYLKDKNCIVLISNDKSECSKHDMQTSQAPLSALLCASSTCCNLC